MASGGDRFQGCGFHHRHSRHLICKRPALHIRKGHPVTRLQMPDGTEMPPVIVGQEHQILPGCGAAEAAGGDPQAVIVPSGQNGQLQLQTGDGKLSNVPLTVDLYLCHLPLRVVILFSFRSRRDGFLHRRQGPGAGRAGPFILCPVPGVKSKGGSQKYQPQAHQVRAGLTVHRHLSRSETTAVRLRQRAKSPALPSPGPAS